MGGGDTDQIRARQRVIILNTAKKINTYNWLDRTMGESKINYY